MSSTIQKIFEYEYLNVWKSEKMPKNIIANVYSNQFFTNLPNDKSTNKIPRLVRNIFKSRPTGAQIRIALMSMKFFEFSDQTNVHFAETLSKLKSHEEKYELKNEEDTLKQNQALDNYTQIAVPSPNQNFEVKETTLDDFKPLPSICEASVENKKQIKSAWSPGKNFVKK